MLEVINGSGVTPSSASRDPWWWYASFFFFCDQDWVLNMDQDLKDVDNEEEARRRGFPKGKTFKLLQYDFVLVESEEAEAARQKFAAERAKNVQ